jgi:hypothetical protein
MNDTRTRPQRGGFEDRLEAELVKVVTARAAVPRRPSRPAAVAIRRPAVRLGIVAVGAAVAAAAGFALGGQSLSRQQAVHIRTAAFSVDTRSDGTVHVRWDKSQYIRDIAGLEQALREAGFPVLIKEGVFCKGPHDDGQLDPSGVGPGVGRVMTGEEQPGGDVVFIFTPSAMPAGEELFIGYLSPSQLAITHGRPGSVERLVPVGVPLTCTTVAPLPS